MGSQVSVRGATRTLLVSIALVCLAAHARVIAADHYGRIVFRGAPVPGATVIASRDNVRRETATDQQGVYHFADIADGVWTVRVEMIGFAALTENVTVGADAAAPTFELTLLPFDEIARGATSAKPEPAEAARAPIAGRQSATASPAPAATSAGFQRAQINTSTSAPAAAASDAASDADRNQSADGFLINGSVNNGAASPFAQLAAFGNNRRGGRSLYNGGIGLLLGNSAWDTRPFSFTSQSTPKPSYSDAQIVASFAGPVRIPRVLRNGPTLFAGYQRTVDHNASTQSVLMPTTFERAGDFSHTRDAFGQPIVLVDPDTRRPFAGNTIPAGRISTQATSLLGYYPLPNADALGGANYQTPTVVTTHQDALQARLTKNVGGGRHQFFANLAWQQTTTDTSNVFGFVDTNRVSGVDTSFYWSHRVSQFWSTRLRYQLIRLATDVTPFFADRTNVSGNAGIGGNNQEPANWGPPRLVFSSGIAGLGGPQFAENRNLTHSAGAEVMWSRGRHTITFGGDARRQRWNVLSQQDARGTFAFTGAATGSDFADFLLGLPRTSSIAYGNADKYLRAPGYDVYVTDDWRVSPVLTVNAGMRWEYEAPVTELRDRLVNLDLTPNFAAAAPVVAGGAGALTGQAYPASLVRPDRRGFQPRAGLAWRPIAGSSLVVRAGYGVYRNTAVYQPIAMLLAQQPPLSTTLSVETSAAHPLTLAKGFPATTAGTNTFAVDPDFRVGYAHSWQLLVQRDLPGSLTVITTYLGTKGSHLVQEFLPNTVPVGAANPCPSCPAGFVYLTSNGHSTRHSGQVQLRRRLRNGLTATVQYTLAKATDDAGAFTGVSLAGSAIAQDWQHLAAEEGPSSFDQRHLVTAQFQYTTGVGVNGGGMLDGVGGRLLNGWTMTSQLSAGSGLPLTPIYLTSVAGTGVTGTIRADVNPALVDAILDGFFANPSAYTVPGAGHWGDAGRNSIRGPRQFSFDAGLGRSFQWGDRLTLDWRVNATNVLNRVTYANVNTIVGSPQFGLPTLANPMRKLQSSLRMRF